jgi:mono/diheme cytochrome c family protein
MTLTHMFLTLSSLSLPVILITGCGSDDKEDTSAAVTFSSVYTDIIEKNDCQQCHKPGGDAQANYGVSLNFSTSALAEQTLKQGSGSSTGTPDCNGKSYVVASKVDESYIAAVFDVISTYSCTPTAYHEGQAQILTAAQKTVLQNWIAGGAL